VFLPDRAVAHIRQGLYLERHFAGGPGIHGGASQTGAYADVIPENPAVVYSQDCGSPADGLLSRDGRLQ